ncbi:MAG: anti-sigma B factor antagonist [Flammeovirgaceae bacterium]|jgi:anti-sigma B factor antagonist
MEVIITEEKPYYTIQISGDLDASSSILLDNALDKALKTTDYTILVDCHKLDYISSPGIGVFTSRLDELEEEGREIILYGVSEKVMNVFKILGLDQLLPIYKNRDEIKQNADGK